MLQLEKDLLEIQLQVSKWQPVIRKIMNPLYGYVQCSYLISNASTYLDTNYIPNTETKLDIKFKLNNLDDNNICFSDNFGIGIRNSKLAYMFGEELVITDVDASVDAIYEVQLSKNGLFVNNLQVVERFSTSIDFVSDKTLLLGAGYDNDDIEILNSKNIYYCKVYDVDEFEYPVMEDGNMIMSVLNQVNLVDDTFESFGGTDTEIKDTLDEVMNKPKTKSNIPDLVRNYTGVRTDADIEEDYVYGFWNYADKKFYTATEGKYIGKDDIEYVELEYIESTGTQYIDTLFCPNQDTTCEVSLYKNTNNACRIFGAWSTSYHENTFSIGTDGPDNSYIGYDSQYDGGNNGRKIPTIPNGNHIVGLYKNVYKLDNNIIKTYNYQNFTCTRSIYLFAQHTHNEALEQYGAYRLYYCKIWNNDTLVRDLIPVKRKSDNVICMYDLGSKQFYTNSGTGTFIAGPEKGDKPYKQLDYVESTGTQYIETNYTPNNNTKVQITVSDVKAINGVPNAVLFSASNTWDYNIFALTYQNQHNVNGYRYMLPGDVVFGNGTYTNKNIIEAYRGSVWFNNSSIRTDTATKTFGHVATLHFCGENRYNDNGYQHNNYKTHSFKIWENDNLRFDFIPVKRKSDDVVCMYDLVSGQFYENAGTGTFIAGPEV